MRRSGKSPAQQAQWRKRQFVGTCLRNSELLKALNNSLTKEIQHFVIDGDALALKLYTALSETSQLLVEVAVQSGWKPTEYWSNRL